MPSTLTHYIFNKQFISNDDKYKRIFLLAGQGADTFFFYGYNIGKRENAADIRKFGSYIHSIDPYKLYMRMLAYSFNKEGEEKEILINFTRGFMYHYALDRAMHPYVFYNTGFPYTNKRYNLNHSIFESNLDTLLMTKYHYRNSTRSVLKSNKKEIMICSKMLYDVSKEVFGITFIEQDTYYKAYKDYRFVRMAIDSRFGVKKFFFNLFMKNTLINTVSQPRKVKDDKIYDYLNIKNREWIVPSSGEIRNDSVADLFKEAELSGRIIDNIIYNFKDNIVTERKLAKFTNNINHDGRNLKNNMTYFKVIWKNR